MKNLGIAGIVLLFATAVFPHVTVAQNAATTLEQLLQNVRQQGSESSEQNRRREQEFLQRRNEQKAILDRARAELREEEARSKSLKATFDNNERELAELDEALRIRVGDMGELFGVVRQLAGDTKGLVDSSDLAYFAVMIGSSSATGATSRMISRRQPSCLRSPICARCRRCCWRK